MKQGWEIKKLGEVCTSDLGKTLNQSRDTGDMHPYLCAINILWDKIDFTTVKQTRFEPSEIDRYSVRKNDLLICEGGDIGRAAIWDKDETMLYQNALHRVRFDGSIIPRFCLLYLRFLKNTGVLDGCYGKGVTIKHLVKSSLLSIPIPVPTLAEQEKIVAELDCLSGIIEKKKQQLKELDNLAQSVFYEMFGSVDDNHKNHEIRTLSEVFSIIKDGTHQTPQYIDDKEIGFKFLSAKDVVGGVINWENIKYISEDLHNELYKRVAPQMNDILLCKNGTYGICALVETDAVFDIYVSLALLRPKESYVPKYLVHAINNPSTKSQFDGSIKGIGVPNLHLGEIKKTNIIVPPLTLQQDFASKIESIEKQKELIAQSIKETETLFNSRMDYYFN